MWLHHEQYQVLESHVSGVSTHSSGFSLHHVFLSCFHSAATSIISICGLQQSCAAASYRSLFSSPQCTERRNTPQAIHVCVAECVSEPVGLSFCVCQDTASICRALEGNARLVSGGQQEGVCVLHSQSRELCNFMLLGAYSTHPGAMHCEVVERMGH